MDKHGIEMMILSLNAPAVQAIHDIKTAIAVAQAGQRRARRRGAQTPRPLRRLCRVADAGPGSRHRRAHPLRQGARHGRRAGQWIFANRNAGQRDLLRSAAIPAVLARGRGARRAVLSAPAQSAAELDQTIRRPFLAARAELGVLGGDGGACAAPDRQRIIRRMPAPEDGARPSRRRHPGAALAHRQPQRLDEGAAQIRREKRRGGLFPQAFPPHHVRQLPHAVAGQRHDRDGRRPRDVLGRLAVRGCGRRRAVVRQGRDQRGRPARRSAATTRSSCSS